MSEILNTDPRIDFVPLDLKRKYFKDGEQKEYFVIDKIENFSLLTLLIEDKQTKKKRVISGWKMGQDFQSNRFNPITQTVIAWKYHIDSDEFTESCEKINKKKSKKKEI